MKLSIGKWPSCYRDAHAGSTCIQCGVSFVAGLTMCVLAAASCPGVQAQPANWDLPELQAARAATAQWDCKAAWEILWPLAKTGNSEARYLLLVARIQNTVPPGADPDKTSDLNDRHNIALAVHAALAQVPSHIGDPNHGWLRREILVYIRKLSLGANGDRVAACYASDGSLRDCLKLALSLGIAPTFEQYVEQVEAAQRRTGIPASCIRLHLHAH
jgi:hypothetical protein